MRINVYSQELTSEDSTVEKESNTGIVYPGVRLMLQSASTLHHSQDDDDRSAITFWLPGNPERRELLARTFERMARRVRTCKTFFEEQDVLALPDITTPSSYLALNKDTGD